MVFPDFLQDGDREALHEVVRRLRVALGSREHVFISGDVSGVALWVLRSLACANGCQWSGYGFGSLPAPMTPRTEFRIPGTPQTQRSGSVVWSETQYEQVRQALSSSSATWLAESTDGEGLDLVVLHGLEYAVPEKVEVFRQSVSAGELWGQPIPVAMRFVVVTEDDHKAEQLDQNHPGLRSLFVTVDLNDVREVLNRVAYVFLGRNLTSSPTGPLDCQRSLAPDGELRTIERSKGLRHPVSREVMPESLDTWWDLLPSELSIEPSEP